MNMLLKLITKCLYGVYFIGPMVYAICYCPISQKDIVNELGFAGQLLPILHF